MKKRPLYLALGALLLGGLWYLFRPELLFVTKKVNEEFPGTAAVSAEASGTPFLKGMFHPGAHETMGTAAIHVLEGGKRVLRLTDFRTSNGPDVRVFLVAAADAMDSDAVKAAGFVDLGSLKGTEGAQNYDVPPQVDLDQYRAVAIWCARFGVNFGTAPLTPTKPEPLSAGTFHGVAHETDGVATIYRLPDGKRVLRFTGFRTSNGPDVQVYLGKAKDASDNDTVTREGFFHVGALRGTEGDQNYELPDSLDLAQYHSVTIWCRRFGVNFATAPLQNPQT
ncbi:MAG TPA: DM13 domain-containing protein [Vicinamibacteria bacterium]|nr:DM13 domain-containing protein [Vicinamibacteria bacterium]